MNNLYGILLISVYIVVIFGISKIFEKKGKEASRKCIHILLSNVWFFSMCFFDNFILASILPAIFVVINTLSYKYDIIKVMERESKNEGLGTVYYALSLTILSIITFYIEKPIVGLLGILIMGYGDGFAAIIGKKVKSRQFKIFGSTKSIAGSLTMFLISLVLSLVVFTYVGTTAIIIKSIAIAIISTVLEAVSSKGLDNITVPLIVSLIFYFVA